MKDLSEGFRKLNHEVDVYCLGNPAVSKNPCRKMKSYKSKKVPRYIKWVD